MRNLNPYLPQNKSIDSKFFKSANSGMSVIVQKHGSK